MCTFNTLLKTLTVLWALAEQHPMVHVSPDPWRWCDQFVSFELVLHFKKNLRPRVEMTLFTLVFHMQLRSWKLKLQPKKIMSYLDKRHVTHRLSSITSSSLTHSHSHTHAHTHTHSNITSNADHTADGYLFPFLFFLLSYTVQSTYVGFISICTFKTAWITVSLERTQIRCD